MAELPFMQFFPTDWLADTRVLTASAKGAWIDSLAALWNAPERGFLKMPERAWGRLWGVEPERVPDLLDELAFVAEVIREKDGVTIASRRMMRDEVERERSRNSKRKEEDRVWNYRESVSARFPKTFPPSSQNLPAEFPPNSQRIPEDILETRDQSKERESASARDDDLAQKAQTIVGTYPRREKLKDALLIVSSQLKDGEDYEAMLAGTKACAAVIRTLPSGGINRYVPNAESFFRGKRWADDPETLRRQGDPKNGAAPTSEDDFVKQLGGRAQNLT